MKTLVTRPVLWAVVAGASLLSIYFLILTIANSAAHVLDEFYAIWYWIVALTVGFSVQAGLFAYIRHAGKVLSKGTATSSVAVSGGVSTTSMVACCAHHVTDIAPILGVSAAAIFLARFQDAFMTIGIFSNIIGIMLMMRIIKKGALFHNGQRLLPSLAKLNYTKAIIVAAAAGVVATGISIYVKL
jgi:hypothetical protein